MKIVQINTVAEVGSTGKIAKQLKLCAEARGHEVTIFHRYQEIGIQTDAVAISSWLDCHVHNRMAMITGLQGCFSRIKTWFFLRKLLRYAPDLVHLHNLHGSYINHRMLFHFLKKHQIPTVWTLHDCWAFTGGCPHFVGYSCDQWKNGCQRCDHAAQNRHTLLDTSSYMWRRKKQWFCGVPDMTLVCPSRWLAGFLEQSYLRDYPVQVIHNGIDLQIFHPKRSRFRQKYGLEHKKILLGVSFVWDEKKGLDVFIQLSKRLPSDYQIVLVGTNDQIDAQLPGNILSIHRTENQEELAGIYSAADVFVNPSREENYPTVNMEAVACGTPVAAFQTGGSPESLDETCGSVVAVDNIDALEREVIRICEEVPYSEAACVQKASAYDMNRCFKEYVDLYERINAAANQADRT